MRWVGCGGPHQYDLERMERDGDSWGRLHLQHLDLGLLNNAGRNNFVQSQFTWALLTAEMDEDQKF